MERREQAQAYFREGYNCAQAVAMTFAKELGMTPEEAAKFASPLGGGMGRLREVCGAVSTAFLVLGAVYGYDTPETGEVKMALYARVQALAAAFEERHGTIVCRELLGLTEKHQAPTPAPRTEAFYQTRPCEGLIGDAAALLGDYLEKNPPAAAEEKQNREEGPHLEK